MRRNLTRTFALLMPGLFMLTACTVGGDSDDDAAEQARSAERIAEALGNSTPAASDPASLTLEERVARAAGPGFGGGTVEVSRADFGYAWPFTVEDGLLSCRGFGNEGAVLFGTEDTAYAINSPAIRHAKAFGWELTPEAIWAESRVLDAKADLAPVVNVGIKLCRA